jgi:hypothetical protein
MLSLIFYKAVTSPVYNVYTPEARTFTVLDEQRSRTLENQVLTGCLLGMKATVQY